MSQKDGPANNLRLTPGRRASKLSVQSDNQLSVEYVMDNEESAHKLKDKEKEKEIKKTKQCRPTGKQTIPLTVAPEQTLMSNFLKKQGEHVNCENEGYDTDPESYVKKDRIRTNSESRTELKEIITSISHPSQSSMEEMYLSANSVTSQELDDIAHDQHTREKGMNIDNGENNNWSETNQGERSDDYLSSRNGEHVEHPLNNNGADGMREDVDPRHKGTIQFVSKSTPVQTTVKDSDKCVSMVNKLRQSDRCLIPDCNLQSGQLLGTEVTDRQFVPQLQHQTSAKTPTHYKRQTYSASTTNTVTTATSRLITTPTFSTAAQYMMQGQNTNMMWEDFIKANENRWSQFARPRTGPVSGDPRVAQTHNVDSNESAVMTMLQQISMQMTGLGGEMTAMRNEMRINNSKIEGIVYDLQDQQETITQTVTSHNKCLDQVELLSNIAVKQEKQIDALHDRIEKMEMTNMKNNMLLYGIEEKENEEPIK